MTELLPIIEQAYPLTPPITLFQLPGGVNNAVVGLHTGDGDFVLKTILAQHDHTQFVYEVQLLRWLAAQTLSFAVPAPVPTRRGDILLATPVGNKALYPFLPGRRPHPTEPAEIRAVGAALGELHALLAYYPPVAHPAYTSYGALDQIHSHLPNPYDLTPDGVGLPISTAHEELFTWWRAELAALRTFVTNAYPQLPSRSFMATLRLATPSTATAM
ncbi:MAG: phosphotransferase [Caldilineaceae bacterium]